MIVRKGFNIYHRKIEKIIEKHPSVASCSVIGVPNDYEGKVPVAMIVLKEKIVADEVLKTELQELCDKNLTYYEIPYKYIYKEKLPQTMLGKIHFSALVEEATKECRFSEEKDEEKSKVYRKESIV